MSRRLNTIICGLSAKATGFVLFFTLGSFYFDNPELPLFLFLWSLFVFIQSALLLPLLHKAVATGNPSFLRFRSAWIVLLAVGGSVALVSGFNLGAAFLLYGATSFFVMTTDFYLLKNKVDIYLLWLGGKNILALLYLLIMLPFAKTSETNLSFMVLSMSFGEALRGGIYKLGRFDYERNGVSDLLTIVLVLIMGIPLVFEKWLLLRLAPAELVKFEYTYKLIELGLTFVTTGLVPLYLSKLAGEPQVADAIRTRATSLAILWVGVMAGGVLFLQGNIAKHIKAFSTFSFLVGLLVLPVMVHLAFERKRVQAAVSLGDLGFYGACCGGRILFSGIVVLLVSNEMMAPVLFMILGLFSVVEVGYLFFGRGRIEGVVIQRIGSR